MLVRHMSVQMGAATNSASRCTDGETIAASISDPARFAVVFDRHYDEIRSYVARRIGRELADEVASETFLRAFAHRERYDSGFEDARPWLYGIATNLVRQHARSEERRRSAYARAVEPDGLSDAVEGVAERVDAASRARAVAVALSRLTTADRDTLLLFALTELDYDGIAIATGVPVGTVRSRLHRARLFLQAALSGGSELSGSSITERTET
jgi:RNA polymerase sigma factor (sigma-70 family)